MSIEIGTHGTTKVGRNLLAIEVLHEMSDGIYQVRNLATGNVMTIAENRINLATAEEATAEVDTPACETEEAVETTSVDETVNEAEEAPETISVDETEDESEAASVDGTVDEAEEAPEATPEGEIEDGVPEAVARPATAPSTPCRRHAKSLMAIAIETLEAEARAMSVGEILAAAERNGLFQPEDWGKTPQQTLYGAFVRETKLKLQPRIVKSDVRGKWHLAPQPEAVEVAQTTEA